MQTRDELDRSIPVDEQLKSIPDISTVPRLFGAELSKRQYEKFILAENGLSIYLITDDNSDGSAASLTVNAGFIDVPFADGQKLREIPHILEHVLFSSSVTDNPEEFVGFISLNSGQYNGTTSCNYTNYTFEINHDMFIKALTLFSQFFKNQQLKKEIINDEINIILEESKCRSTNGDRSYSGAMSDEVYDPVLASSLLCLLEPPQLSPDEIHQLIQSFFEKHYSADEMYLTLVTTTEKRAEVLSIIKEHFSQIPRRKLAPISLQKIFQREAYEIFIPRKSFVDSLMLQWEIAEDINNDALGMLIWFLKQPFPGSLLSSLKGEGLIFNLNCTKTSDYRGAGIFGLEFILTNAGSNRRDDIICSVFSFFASLKSQGFLIEWQQYVINLIELDMKKISRIGAYNVAKSYSLEMHQILINKIGQQKESDFSLFPDSKFLYHFFSDEEFYKLMNMLIPENLISCILIPFIKFDEEDIEKKFPKISKEYGTRYCAREIDSERLQRWKTATQPVINIPSHFFTLEPINNNRDNEEIKNISLETDFQLLKTSGGITSYFLEDTQFGTLQAGVDIYFYHGYKHSLYNHAFFFILENYISLHFSDLFLYTHLDESIDVSIDFMKLTICIRASSSRLQKIIDLVFQTLQNIFDKNPLYLSENWFAEFKNADINLLANKNNLSPDVLLADILSRLSGIQNQSFSRALANLGKTVTDGFTFEMFIAELDNVFKEYYVSCLLTGNIKKEVALNIHDDIEREINKLILRRNSKINKDVSQLDNSLKLRKDLPSSAVLIKNYPALPHEGNLFYIYMILPHDIIAADQQINIKIIAMESLASALLTKSINTSRTQHNDFYSCRASINFHWKEKKLYTHLTLTSAVLNEIELIERVNEFLVMLINDEDINTESKFNEFKKAHSENYTINPRSFKSALIRCNDFLFSDIPFSYDALMKDYTNNVTLSEFTDFIKSLIDKNQHNIYMIHSKTQEKRQKLTSLSTYPNFSVYSNARLFKQAVCNLSEDTEKYDATKILSSSPKQT